MVSGGLASTKQVQSIRYITFTLSSFCSLRILTLVLAAVEFVPKVQEAQPAALDVVSPDWPLQIRIAAFCCFCHNFDMKARRWLCKAQEFSANMRMSGTLADQTPHCTLNSMSDMGCDVHGLGSTIRISSCSVGLALRMLDI